MNKSVKLKSPKKVKHSFAAGAIIMAVGMLIVKIAGAAFKIPLTYILGGLGMGYFGTAYTMYSPIHALATAGLPIAISRMVSEYMAQQRYKDVKMIHKVSVPIFLCTGFLGTSLMMISSFSYVRFINSPGSLYSLLILAPTIFFSCLISIYKGYYEGLRNMIPTAVSEIVEAIGKVVFGITFSYFTLWYGMKEFNSQGTVFGVAYLTYSEARNAVLPWASAGAVLGITFGSIAGYLYMVIKYKFCGDGITQTELQNSPEPYPVKKLIKTLLSISVPVALGAIIMNIASAIDATLVQRRLNDIMHFAPGILIKAYSGLIPIETINSGSTHVFLAGCFSYMNTVTMLLPTITQGLAISALPNVTDAWVGGIKEKIQKSIETVLKVTSIISFPIGLGMSVISFPIMDLIYNTLGKNKSLGEVCIASQIMSIYALGIIFVAIGTPICSILQAVGRADIPLKLLLVGVIMKVVLNYILVGIPQINIQGAGIGTLVCYLFVCIVGLICLRKEIKMPLSWTNSFIKPLICSIMCAIAAYTSHGLISAILPFKFATILSIAISGIVYVLALFLTNTVTSSDLMTIPKCKKIVKTLEKVKLIR